VDALLFSVFFRHGCALFFDICFVFYSPIHKNISGGFIVLFCHFSMFFPSMDHTDGTSSGSIHYFVGHGWIVGFQLKIHRE